MSANIKSSPKADKVQTVFEAIKKLKGKRFDLIVFDREISNCVYNRESKYNVKGLRKCLPWHDML